MQKAIDIISQNFQVEKTEEQRPGLLFCYLKTTSLSPDNIKLLADLNVYITIVTSKLVIAIFT